MTSTVNHQGNSVFGNAIAKLKVSRLVFSNSVGIVNRAQSVQSRGNIGFILREKEYRARGVRSRSLEAMCQKSNVLQGQIVSPCCCKNQNRVFRTTLQFCTAVPISFRRFRCRLSVTGRNCQTADSVQLNPTLKSLVAITVRFATNILVIPD